LKLFELPLTRLTAALVILSASPNTLADNWLDFIREYDLNDYALGLSLSTGQNLYKGSENSSFLYPYLTSFRASALTDDWIVLNEGDLGFRYVNKTGWTIGAVGRIQTTGLGDNEALADIEDRKWTVEVAPAIGYRAWPVHINFKTYFEVTGRHEGTISQLEFSYPRGWDRGFLVPAIEFIHQSSDYSNYYYSVSDSETAPGRPEYEAGSASNIALKIQWGYAPADRWLLSGRISLEYLDDAITDSPIVDRDKIWSASLGLAYNANIFQPRLNNNPPVSVPKMQFRVSVFDAHLDTTLTTGPESMNPGSEVDLGDALGISDRETVGQFDFTLRLGTYHRLEASYTDIQRSGSTTINSPFRFQNSAFQEGTTLKTKIDSRILRLSYGYSLMKDSQKELGVSAGIHSTNINTRFFVPETGQEESFDNAPLLPMIGVFGSVRLGKHSSLSAEIQIFRMDFNRYEGSLNYLRLEWLRHFGIFDLGLGYSYYGMNLDSHTNDFGGSIEFRHRGPILSGTFRF
jgi:outer membrane protein